MNGWHATAIRASFGDLYASAEERPRGDWSWHLQRREGHGVTMGLAHGTAANEKRARAAVMRKVRELQKDPT